MTGFFLKVWASFRALPANIEALAIALVILLVLFLWFRQHYINVGTARYQPQLAAASARAELATAQRDEITAAYKAAKVNSDGNTKAAEAAVASHYDAAVRRLCARTPASERGALPCPP